MNTRVWLGAGALLVGGWITARVIRTAQYTLRGKVAVISGGSRGLGLVLARHICDRGGNVALLARDPEELARAKADLTASADCLFAGAVRCTFDVKNLH